MPVSEEGDTGQGVPFYLDLDGPPDYRPTTRPAASGTAAKQEALAYAAAGWPVLWVYGMRRDETGQWVCTCGQPSESKICNPSTSSRGKHPPFGGHGAHDATTDPGAIEAWPWADGPNIGIAGRDCNPIIDIDDSEIAAKLLSPEFGLRDLATASTTGRGLHIYMQCAPTQNGIIKAADGSHVGEIRGHGNYVVAPPSMHWTGRQYAWIGGSVLEQGPTVSEKDAWGWLSDLLRSLGVEIAAPSTRRTEAIPDTVLEPREVPWSVTDTVLHTELTRPELHAGRERSSSLYRLGHELARSAIDAGLKPEAQVIAAALKGVDIARGAFHPKGPKYATRHDGDRYYWDIALQSVPEDGMTESSSAASSLIVWDHELHDLPPREWRVEDVFGDNELGGFFGDTATLKSFLALSMAHAVATGTPWFGRATKRGRVVYVCGEGFSGQRERLAALTDHTGESIHRRIAFVRQSVELLDSQQVDVLLREIQRMMPDEPPVEIFIDTYSRAIAGHDENSSKDTSQAVKQMDRIRRETGAGVRPLHHVNRSDGKYRGHSALAGAMDTMILVERADDRITVSCAKQKDGREFEPFSLRLIPHLESIVLVPVDALVAAAEDATAASATLNALRQLGTAATWTQWSNASGVPQRTFGNHLKVLLASGMVVKDGKTYCLPLQEQ